MSDCGHCFFYIFFMKNTYLFTTFTKSTSSVIQCSHFLSLTARITHYRRLLCIFIILIVSELFLRNDFGSIDKLFICNDIFQYSHCHYHSSFTYHTTGFIILKLSDTFNNYNSVIILIIIVIILITHVLK